MDHCMFLSWLAFLGAQEQLLLWLIEILHFSTSLLCDWGVLHPTLSKLRLVYNIDCFQHRCILVLCANMVFSHLSSEWKQKLDKKWHRLCIYRLLRTRVVRLCVNKIRFQTVFFYSSRCSIFTLDRLCARLQCGLFSQEFWT